MIYNDDEKILKNQGNSTEEEDADLDLDGRVEGRIVNKVEAPLEETPLKVLLELKGVGSDEGRLGVDLVTILDISGSMKGTKIEKMQLAMQFLVQKLGPTDRLSVVTFNRKAERLCPLRQMTENSRMEIADQVNALVARSSTNTAAGLKMALNILGDRSLTKRRRCAIMLMSDGVEDDESDSASVDVGKVPVYTFGFGSDCDPDVLREIAKNGGMFSAVSNLDNLSIAFSTCLAGLLNVAIDDLTLTIIPLIGTKFMEVNAGNYQQTKGSNAQPVSVSFGSLYDRESRKVLVKFILPKVDQRKGGNVFTIAYKYRVGGKDTFKSHEENKNVSRKPTSTEKESAEVLAEETRIMTANSMKEARLLADAKKLEEARSKLVDAKASLSEVDAILKAQLDQLLLFMASQETYDKQGRAFALALEASHDSQRATASGDAAQAGMFNTPIMDLFIEQAMLFDKNPEGYKPPTEEEDRKVVLNKIGSTIGLINDIINAIKNNPVAGFFRGQG
ncbi:hypothetical protein ACHQM5_020091 [Ranunculus cassubicifolius]